MNERRTQRQCSASQPGDGPAKSLLAEAPKHSQEARCLRRRRKGRALCQHKLIGITGDDVGREATGPQRVAANEEDNGLHAAARVRMKPTNRHASGCNRLVFIDHPGVRVRAGFWSSAGF